MAWRRHCCFGRTHLLNMAGYRVVLPLLAYQSPAEAAVSRAIRGAGKLHIYFEERNGRADEFQATKNKNMPKNDEKTYKSYVVQGSTWNLQACTVKSS